MIKLHPNEVVHNNVHRHWFKFATESISMFALIIVPCLIYPVVLATGWIDFDLADFSLFLFIMSSIASAIWLVFSILYTNYYLDVWIITNQRIVDIEQHGLYVREVSEYRIDRIQDITVKTGGILSTYLNFGDVEIQTAGESSDKFVIKNAAFPHKVKDDITRLQSLITQAAPQPAPMVHFASHLSSSPNPSPQPANPATPAVATPPDTPPSQPQPPQMPAATVVTPPDQSQLTGPASPPANTAAGTNPATPSANVPTP